MKKWPCLTCGKHHHDQVPCPSGSSACSGADARQEDKASVGEKDLIAEAVEWICTVGPIVQDGQTEVKIGKRLAILLSQSKHLSKAAVSPRSSDGLLPCPFCCYAVGREDLVEHLGGWCVKCPVCDSRGSIWASDKTAVSYWNMRDTRAAMA